MKKHFSKRLLALMLAVVVCASVTLPASAADSDGDVSVTVEKVDNSMVSASVPGREPVELPEMEEPYADNEVVRVSIVLEKAGTIEAGFTPMGIAENASAMSYRDGLKQEQLTMAQKIEKKTGETLDVVWNLTLAANIISANVKYGQIETIESIPGVASVFIETRYEPDVVTSGGVDPNMATSGEQTGTSAAWSAGYTGAGSRIAIIDTGLDTSHEAFNEGAFEYSLGEDMASLDLLDKEEITSALSELNVQGVSADYAYISSKIPFALNYVDLNYNVTHLYDEEGEHGSHVAGIAAANKYVSDGEGGYVEALETTYVQGVAPDAQLIIMKVFGQGGGAYDSDYMVAIEDAVILGADSINLSLGSGNPGMSRSSEAAYQAIMDNLVNSGVVVTMSAGNSGSWVDNSANGVPYLYLDDVSMQMNGSPGSYSNSMAVASADNSGYTDYCMHVGENKITYAESTGYGNGALTSIAGEYEYVFLNGIGTVEEFESLGVDLTGKIALCYRGTTSFYEKANAAASLGAAGVIVVNNTSGVIYMNLSGYEYTVPVVSITQASGEYFKTGAPITDSEGDTLGWTGTMTIDADLSVGQYDSEYYTMSSFSSWGVPGSLELKPEITAPGGSIYSVAGMYYDSDVDGYVYGDNASYELMSGTSMAAPQVAGMAAVMAQYIREEGLAEKTGLDERTLTQSLLMSTAVPMRDGSSEEVGYYPVLQQGAGLANVGAATMADSYILMGADATASYADGKVKAELGDDPEKTGVYSFSFTINNLTDEVKTFALSADVFTQGAFAYAGALYMDTWTTSLNPTVTWTVDGMAIENSVGGLDFDGDEDVDVDDGQALLDYVVGVKKSIANVDVADLDNDGDVDTYDVYTFFSYSGVAGAALPANGSVEVEVTITLSESDREWLAYYENGAYIEAYVYAETLATDEGVEGTSHSIPVLGFYGNWSDASMYDVGSLPEFWYGLEDRYPYLPDSDGYPEMFTNFMTIKYAGETGEYYYFGNPLADDDEYLPERNAFNNEVGDKLYKYYFSVIRNAGAAKYMISDAETGKVYLEEELGSVRSAYYYANGGYWVNTQLNLKADWEGTDAEGNKLPEGSSVNISLILAPEYYVSADGSCDWDALGEGAYLTTMTTIDNTAPAIKENSVNVDLENMVMDVTASDNEYLAVVALYDATGANALTYAVPNQTVAGEEQQVELDLSKVVGKSFLLQVVDYAMNTTTYKVSYELLPDLDGYYTFFDMGKEVWYSYTEDGTESAVMGSSPMEIYAADYVDGYVFAVDENNDLYVMPDNDFANVTFITHLDDGVNLTGEYDFFVSDMAYNTADKKLYLLAYSDSNSLYYPYLYSVDLFTGELTLFGEIYADTWTLAIDDEGTFYGQGTFDNTLYKYTIETWDEPETVAVLGDELAIYMAQSSLAWDGKNDKLVFTLATSSYTTGQVLSADIFLIDPATGEHEKLTSHQNMYAMVGTYVRNGEIDATRFAPTDKVSSLTLSESELELLRSETATLSAKVLPWNVSDESVTWTSSDTSVATVDGNGVVTAVSKGTAVITAASALDPTVTASCSVTVTAVEAAIYGVLQDTEGDPMFFSWDMANDSTWTPGVALDTSLTSAAYDSYHNELYVMDAVNWNMHKVDMTTGESTATYVNSIGVPLWDMEVSKVFTLDGTASAISGIYGPYFMPLEDPTALSGSAFNLTNNMANYTGGSYLTAITSLGLVEIDTDDDDVDDTYAEEYLLLDNAGYIWLFDIYISDSGMGAMLGFMPTTLPELEFPGYGDDLYCSMIAASENGELALYLSYFNGETNEIYRMTYANGTFEAKRLGDIGEGVWPAALYAATASEEEIAAAAEALPETTMYTEAVEVSAEEMVALLKTEEVTTGGLDSVATYYTAPARPMSDSSVDDGEDYVTLTVTAKNAEGVDVSSTNGLVTVTYDADALTLDTVKSSINGDCTAVKVEKIVDETTGKTTGVLTFGYVSLEGVEELAELVFTVVSTDCESVTILHKELGESAPDYEETVAITYEHANTEVRNVKEKTCTEDGYTGDTYCLDCGEMIEEGEVIPAGHGDTEVRGAVEATCTKGGYTGDTHCTVCGDMLEEGETIPAFGHSPILVNDEKPTFTEPGYSGDTVCSVCGTTLSTGQVLPPVDAETTTPVTPPVEPDEPDEPVVDLPFEDVNMDDWFYKDVCYVYANGLMEGVSDTLFAPNTEMSRAMVVTVLYRMAGEPAVSGESHFTDLTQDWYMNAVQWAVENGITKGVSETEFAPDQTVTREQLVTFLYRYAQYKGIDVSVGENTNILSYLDAESISEYAIPAFQWACGEGIIEGSEGYLAPAASATRAQAAAVLHRFLAE